MGDKWYENTSRSMTSEKLNRSYTGVKKQSQRSST